MQCEYCKRRVIKLVSGTYKVGKSNVTIEEFVCKRHVNRVVQTNMEYNCYTIVIEDATKHLS